MIKNILIGVLFCLLLISWAYSDTIRWKGKTYYYHETKTVNDTIDDGEGFVVITKGTRTYYDHFPCEWKKR